MRLLEALTHFFYNDQRTLQKYLLNCFVSECSKTSEVLNTTKDIERKEAQKEKRKIEKINRFHYRDLRPSTVQKERVCYSLLDHNEQAVPKSLLVVNKETLNFRIVRKVPSG